MKDTTRRIRAHLDLNQNHEAGLIPIGTQVFLSNLADVLESGLEPYLVWSNEHRAWWRANRAGYSVAIEAAGVYTRKQAFEIADGARIGGWSPDQPLPEIAVAVADLPPPAREVLGF